jgi:hypothetical protein
MTGQTIASRRPLPLWPVLLGLAAAGLDVAAAVTGASALAVLSAWPWLAALLMLPAWPRRFEARFTETALEVIVPPLVVPYADLEGLRAPRPLNPYKAGKRRYPIQILHAGGVLHIPAALNVPSDQVFAFLYQQIPAGGDRDVPDDLRDFLVRKERAYGRERVWACTARTHLGKGRRYLRAAAFFLALALAGVFWVVWGLNRRQEGWVAAAIPALFLGLLFAVLFCLDSLRGSGTVRVKGWQRSGLVVAPDGLALVQGDLTGQLRWDEVRDVTLGRGSRGFFYTEPGQLGTGIRLKVEGAVILIADIYNRPLFAIYQKIREGWQEGSDDDED